MKDKKLPQFDQVSYKWYKLELIIPWQKAAIK